jgi:hypothetical protein
VISGPSLGVASFELDLNQDSVKRNDMHDIILSFSFSISGIYVIIRVYRYGRGWCQDGIISALD